MKTLIVYVYEDMKDIALKLINKYKEENIDLLFSDGHHKEKIKFYLDNHNYDLIISRGGVYSYLKKITKAIVIDVGLSIYDIISTIDIKSQIPTLIIGQENLTNEAKLLNFNNINTITIKGNSDLSSQIDYIKKFHLIYTGASTKNYLKNQGIKAELLKNSFKSLENAYLTGKELYLNLNKQKNEEAILTAFLMNEHTNIFIYNEHGQLIKKSIIFPIFNKDIEQIINNNIKELLTKNKSIALKKQNYLININSKKFHFASNKYIAIKISINKSIDYNYIYIPSSLDNYHISLDINKSLTLYSINNIPICLLYQNGSGEDMLVKKIIESSLYKDNTSFILDFNLITKREFNTLLNSPASILNLENHTIILKNLNALDNYALASLVNYISESKLTSNNKLIILINENNNNLINELNQITYYLVRIPSINNSKQKKEIINDHLKSLKINLDNESLNLLYDYNYFQNESELIRIANEIKSFESPTINDIKSILNNETYQNISYFNIENKTLSEIEYNACCYILKECNYNQTLAAKRLGIGRTTLWRILNKNL